MHKVSRNGYHQGRLLALPTRPDRPDPKVSYFPGETRRLMEVERR